MGGWRPRVSDPDEQARAVHVARRVISAKKNRQKRDRKFRKRKKEKE